MSTSSSNISQSFYSTSEPETPQGASLNRIPSFDQSLNHSELNDGIVQSLKNAQKELHQKRIQALRKELDYLKSTEWEFEPDKGNSSTDQDDNISSKEEFLSQQLLDLEIMNDENKYCKESIDQHNLTSSSDCFQRTGVVTFVSNDYCLIDGMFYCPFSAFSVNAKQNDRIVYLGYENKDGMVKVIRLLSNLGPTWGSEDNAIEEEKFKLIEHVIIGQVDYRQERKVFIKDSDLVFSLDEVEASFVPVQGDWLELNCSVQWDNNNPSDIAPAQVVEVLSAKPLRTKIKGASITSWDGTKGICDRDIYFDKQTLQNGAEPRIGSKVIIEAIESNQGACSWRAIKIIIDNSEKHIATQENTVCEEESSFRIERERSIDMTYPISFDQIRFNSMTSMLLNITNKSNTPYTIVKWFVLGRKRDSQIIIKPVLTKALKLHPQKTFSLTITCKPKILGISKEILIISFQGFQLKRSIHINVESHKSVQNLSTSTQERKSDLPEIMRTVRGANQKQYIPGVRPIKPPNFIPVRLGSFEIPDKIWSVVLGDSEQTIYGNDYANILYRIESNFPFLSNELDIYNYTDIWHTLLYMEEIQQNIHMRVYDMQKTFLSPCGEYLSLEISGLSEKRPSIIFGDRVIVTDIWDTTSPKYEGYIHVVKGDLILMKFNRQFHDTYSGSDVSLEFHFSRSMYRRGHQAINLALTNLGPDILFPSRIKTKKPQIGPEMINYICWYNKKLNDGQKAAVANIILGECRPMPYVLYGPPGTGKTITLVETILQILSHLPDSRILVAAPSNSAANLLTERLLEYRNHFSQSIVRLIAHHLVNSDSLTDVIKPFCASLDIAAETTAKSRKTVNPDGISLNCRTSFVGRHRVTIGTCYCLGSLALMGLPRGHFTHVIIDEAGQATEPEIMIPLTFIDKDNGQIILAGDPMQLGPVVISKYCQEFGMAESFLCRLIERFPYQKDYEAFKEGFDSRLVTRLTENYRSLQEVLYLPSKMFYDGILVPKIIRTQDWIVNTAKIVSEIFGYEKEEGGVYVNGIRGINQRAEDSPSWFNPQEASMLALTTCKLYKKGLTSNDIGVITPYIAQVKHIRLVFDAMGLDHPKIGSVEEFQGQERAVILISTVRSNESYLMDDHKHALGFVRNPKRANVALTRAKVAVILFCNPHLLSKDSLWGRVIEQSVIEDKYSGCDLPNELLVDKSK